MAGDPDCSLPDYNAYVTEGEKLEKAGSIQQAIKFFTKALDAITPNGIMADPIGRHGLCARSRCHLSAGDHEAALADAEAALVEDDAFVKGIYAKAEALYFKGDFEWALVFYHRGKQIRPEMESFRLGVQKASEAIDNAVGNPATCRLKASGDLAIFHEHDALNNQKKKKNQSKRKPGRKNAGPTTPAASDRSVKQLLGELYDDRKYLEELMNDPAIGGSGAVQTLVSGEISYLDKRTEFWRQQKPIYARRNEQRQKTLKMTRGKGTLRANGKKSGSGNAKQHTAVLRSIEQSLERDEPEKALTQAKSLLKAMEGMKTGNKLRGEVFSHMGTAYFELGDLTRALEYHNKDLALAKKGRDDVAVGRALANSGRVYARQGDYQQAIDAWTQKVPMDSTPVESAWLYHEIGRCHIELGDCMAAAEFGQKSLACAAEAGDERWKLNANVLIAQSYVKDNDFQEAVTLFEAAKTIAEQLQDERASDAVEKALQEVRGQMVTSAEGD